MFTDLQIYMADWLILDEPHPMQYETLNLCVVS